MHNLILFSQDTDRFHDRHPLDRVILPAEVGLNSDPAPEEHVWWVERSGKSYYLRAKLYVAGTRVDQDLESGNRWMVWHLDTVQSERITWSGTKPQGAANVTELLHGAGFKNPNGLELWSIQSGLDWELEHRRLDVSEDVWRFDQAALILDRLFQRTRAHFAPEDLSLSSLEDAGHFVRRLFARQELVSLPGYDVYEVAAAVLAGYRTLPVRLGLVADDGSSSAAGYDDFEELDEENLGYLDAEWATSPSSPIDPRELAKSTRRHQRILQALSRQVRNIGLCPTYNRHVDMRIEREHEEVYFEVKTVDVDNLLEQTRRAVGQLLEYRFRYKGQSNRKPIQLVAVIEEYTSHTEYDFVRRFLTDVGIALVLWKPTLTVRRTRQDLVLISITQPLW